MNELCDIARESKVIGYSKYKKVGLVKFLSRRANSVKRSLTDQSSRYELYLSTLSMSELRDIARESKVIGYSKYKKAGLVKFFVETN